MTPTPHIHVIVDPQNGDITFICNFCGAMAGPVPKGVPVGHVEIFHLPECLYTEANRLNARMAAERHDN